MTTTNSEHAVQTCNLTRDVRIYAPIEIAFDAVLAELGPEGQMPDGKPFPFTLEPWPGGRWFRDLGNNTGHLWGHVQVIKPPKLIEVCGPMFASHPVANHVQYRLAPEGDGATRLTFTHRAFGYMPKGFIDGTEEGWAYKLNRIAEIAARMTGERRKGNAR